MTTEWATFECANCGWGGNRIHPVSEDILQGDELCATCRVDEQLKQ